MTEFTVITFGTAEFSRSVELQKQRSLQLGAHHHVAYTIDSPSVRTAHSENAELASVARGYGLWIWKPYILLDALARCAAGDYVIYLDAGVAPVAPMMPWFTQLRRHPLNLFAPVPPQPARLWTKRMCFTRMNADASEYHAAPMLSAGIQAYRNGPESHDFVAEMKTWMRNPHLVNDAGDPGGAGERQDFVAHRHDQSILSVQAALRGIPIQREPSQYGIWKPEARNAYRASTAGHQGLLDEECPQVLDVHRGRNRSRAVLWHLWRIRRKATGACHGVACI